MKRARVIFIMNALFCLSTAMVCADNRLPWGVAGSLIMFVANVLAACR